MSFWKWSRTAASNGTADGSINWQEGQAPSTINDSGRAMMAAAAKYRDDVSGQIVTGGTSTAFTLTSFQGFTDLVAMHGKTIFFTPHATNGANGTSLNVDGLGVKPILTAPGKGLPGGVLIAGTPYGVVYNNTDNAFYVMGYFGDPYSIPIGASVDFWGSAVPNSSFALMYGQAISRVTYADLFGLLGTTFGAGDGVNTFNIPDCRGRVIAGKDDMGGSSANRLTNADDGLNGDNLGATGGGETQSLATANLPPYTPQGNLNLTATVPISAPSAFNLGAGGTNVAQATGSTSVSFSVSQFVGVAQGGTSTAFGVIQPTIIANKLLRII